MFHHIILAFAVLGGSLHHNQQEKGQIHVAWLAQNFDGLNIVCCQYFEQVMEYGFVLYLSDYDEGYHIYDDTKHDKVQNYMN